MASKEDYFKFFLPLRLKNNLFSIKDIFSKRSNNIYVFFKIDKLTKMRTNAHFDKKRNLDYIAFASAIAFFNNSSLSGESFFSLLIVVKSVGAELLMKVLILRMKSLTSSTGMSSR